MLWAYSVQWFGRQKIKQLLFLSLTVIIVRYYWTHAWFHQTTSSHYWYVGADPALSFSSPFSCSLKTGSMEKTKSSPATYSDHWVWKLRFNERLTWVSVYLCGLQLIFMDSSLSSVFSNFWPSFFLTAYTNDVGAALCLSRLLIKTIT